MSTSQQFSNDHNTPEDYGEPETLSARERVIGLLLLIAIILMAIYLR